MKYLKIKINFNNNKDNQKKTLINIKDSLKKFKNYIIYFNRFLIHKFIKDKNKQALKNSISAKKRKKKS